MIASEPCAGLWFEILSSLETDTVLDFVEGFCGGNKWVSKTKLTCQGLSFGECGHNRFLQNEISFPVVSRVHFPSSLSPNQ